jgi:hypothetical protein
VSEAYTQHVIGAFRRPIVLGSSMVMEPIAGPRSFHIDRALRFLQSEQVQYIIFIGKERDCKGWIGFKKAKLCFNLYPHKIALDPINLQKTMEKHCAQEDTFAREGGDSP